MLRRLALTTFASLLTLTVPFDVASSSEIQYNRDVRPILADKCFACHGPDAAAREADLRLDERRGATADRGGYFAVDAGNPETSELIRRIASSDEGERMPPAESGSPLTAEQISILRQWIRQGAEYQTHWSFIPPRRTAPPAVRNRDWPCNAIDRFVLARLEQERLPPSRQADPATLIRRVTLALTGLPPALDEVDAFERDFARNADAAYSRLVDRLLASPRYGEHMALAWLDAARYADTNGYFTDNERTMWPWRDWVIDAYNANMPFDQFTIEQLAGDLLPQPTLAQKIATGFNRNHMVNNETGIIEEEFRVEYVADRVDTTATVWLGLTLSCARCHDHKYDPISQKDFYRFFGFFNHVPETGLSGSSGNSAPLLKVASQQQQAELEQLNAALAEAERQFATVAKQLDRAQAEWEKTALEQLSAPPSHGLVAHYTLDQLTDGQVSGDLGVVEGMLGKAAKFDGDACVQIPAGPDFERTDAFSFGAWIKPAGAGCVISRMDDADNMRGFDVTLRKGKAVVNLVHLWNRDAIQVTTSSKIPSGQWQHLMVTYDGSSKAAGVAVFLDGKQQPIEVEHDSLTGTIRNNEPLRFGRRQASDSFSGEIDDVRIYDRQLSSDEVHDLASIQLVQGIVTRPPDQRSSSQHEKLRDWYLEHVADEQLATASDQLAQLRKQQRKIANSIPTTMVMQDAEKPRETFLLVRGQYDAHGEQVTAGVPDFLQSATPFVSSATSQYASANRLELANWLVDPANPLTARVTVNRLWQQLFGTGIVKTVDDFGTQGEWPSHPELLDWLAVELVESGWDIKHVLRLMVTSATYRQSSHCSEALLQRDSENRLLARGPRFRMDAETVRDNALAVSGLLVERLGGPSVKPYQPAGLWESVTYDSDVAYQQDQGSSLYRRSLYTYWKRQSPPANLLVFDAPTRETCVVERSRTNTPLQALVLMNDPTFVEAARALAERTMQARSGESLERIDIAFRSATARRPTPAERKILLDVFRKQRVVFDDDPDAADQLLSVGESSCDQSLDKAQLAAWTTVASMILSLDETITRP